ncbi:MAG TPA: Ig-like domain repeat protein [Solirubrobacteraceae bacterium]|nr:Ig-like domain repeat protein [Solirubrobacteraceae bacterium]
MQRLKYSGGVFALALAVWLASGATAAQASVARATPFGSSSDVVSFTSVVPTAPDNVVGATYAAIAVDSSEAVSFSVDAATTNAACVVTGATVTFEHAGTCVIDASVPTDLSATPAQQTITVAPASTSTSLVIGTSVLTATVSTSAPGSGTATGTVLFSVGGKTLGTATLVNGIATLPYTVPANVTEAILAGYQGAADYTTSSATVTANGLDIEPTFVAKPTIAARVTSAAPKNARGWWHTKVKVHFSCDGAGSTIIGGCPRALVLTRSGADVTVIRTIRTVKGSSATVELRGLKIDLKKPKVEIVGVRDRALYHGSRPPVSCAATDPISGIASCRVVTTVKRTSTLDTITFTAIAKSWAGLTRRTSETIYSKV